MKMVKVTWVDTAGMNNWQHKRTIDDWMKEGPEVMESVGYLYKKDKKSIVIAQSIHKDDNGSNLGEPLMIPIKHIIKLEILRRK
jgi:hypothetical protein